MTFAVSSRFPLSLAGLGRNLYGHLAFVPAHLPGGRTRAEVDALLVDSGLPCDTFNKITRPVSYTHLTLPTKLEV